MANFYMRYIRGLPASSKLLEKEMKCSGDSEILRELVHDTTRKSEKHELIRVISWTNPCSQYLGFPATLYFLSNSEAANNPHAWVQHAAKVHYTGVWCPANFRVRFSRKEKQTVISPSFWKTPRPFGKIYTVSVFHVEAMLKLLMAMGNRKLLKWSRFRCMWLLTK